MRNKGVGKICSVFIKQTLNESKPSQTIVIIPARYQSSRLPGKALLPIDGVPMVVKVMQQVQKSSRVQQVVVATDHPDILQAVESFEGVARMTSPTCECGTDRVAEVAQMYPEYDLVINVQGDQVEFPPSVLDDLVLSLEHDSLASMATPIQSLQDEEAFNNPNVVKVVCDQDLNALYFSRSPIPYPRSSQGPWFKHIGIYAFRREFLFQFASWSPTPLEKSESLEQLRALERGKRIKCVLMTGESWDINTREDYDRYLARKKGNGF